MTETTKLALPLIAEAQAQKHITHNEALLKLDVLVQMAVVDRDQATPPAAPEEGQAWIVATGAADDWAGHDGEVAAWQGGTWRFYAPSAGWVAWVMDEGRLLIHDGTAWAALDAATLGGRPASDYVTAGALATATVGDADTVDGHHASEFALLSGATFTGGVTAAAFTGDGSGLTNVDAATLGGHPASDFATQADLATVSASGGDADTVDGHHADEFAPLAGAEFTGRVRAPSIYAGRPELYRDVGAGSASLEMGGWAGSWVCNVQDGTGRVSYRWNATSGPQPKFVVDGDRAVEWDLDGWGGFGLTIRESGINTGAGSSVSFVTLLSVGRGGIKGFVPFILPSRGVASLPDAARAGAGALLFVPDESGGPTVAFSDGTAWRRMGDRAIVS